MRLIVLLLLISELAFSQNQQMLMRTKVAAGPSFQPTDVPNLLVWWESDSGVTESAGSVSSWVDQIGGYTVTASGSNQPTYQSSVSFLNNQPGINFDGINDNLFMSTVIPKGSDFTVIILAHPESSNIERRPMGWEYTSSELSFFTVQLFDDNTSRAATLNSSGNHFTNLPAGTFTDNTTHLFSSTFEENVEMVHWRDLTKSVPVAIGTYLTGLQTDRFRIGSNRSATGQFFDGYILSVLIYSKALSDTEIENLYNNYFAPKYGL